MRFEPPQWMKRYWFVVFVLSSILVLQVLPGPSAFDDAYITYRYSLNLASGNGFSYNPGEQVLGTTTPLYTIILAAASLATSSTDFPTISLIVNSLTDVASVWVLLKLIEGFKLPKSLATMFAVAYLFNPLRIGISRGGMETPLVILIILAALYAYIVKNNNSQAAILSGIAFLIRPDTLLLPAILAAVEFVRFRRIPLREGLIFLVLIGPWLLFSGLYFGSLLPHSITAKSSAYLIHRLHAITSILGYIATRQPIRYAGWPMWALGISLLLNLWLFTIGSNTILQKNDRALVVPLYIVVYAVALMIANPLLFVWYFLPFGVLFNALVVIGVYSLFASVKPDSSAFAAAGFVLFLLIIEWTVLEQPNEGLSVSLRDHEALYEAVGEMLQDEIFPGSTIAMPEIGVLGYSFPESRVLDTVGIVSPESTQYLYSTPQAGQDFSYVIPIELILDRMPDFVLSLDVFFLPDFLRTSEFLDQYQILDVIPTHAMGSEAFYIFEHVDAE